MYIIYADKWSQWESGAFKDCINLEYKGETLKECMAQLNSDKMNNDLARYTPIAIYNVVNTEEENM